jgi:hypothetical protein
MMKFALQWREWPRETRKIVDLVYVATHAWFHELYPHFPTEPERMVTRGDVSGEPLRVNHPTLGSILVYHEDAEPAVRAHFGEDEGDVWMTPHWENP